MHHFKTQLLIPGPAPVPPGVGARLAEPIINHRGSLFHEKLPVITRRLQPLFGTANPIYIITASGTGGMEAAVANLVSPGTAVLCLVGGFFGQRWSELCQAFGGTVHTLNFPWGAGIDPAQVGDFLEKHPEIEVIFAVHNESSTGVLNNIQAISRVRGDHQALLVVDTVSSLGGTPVEMDAWGLDVVVSASQKCLMVPPGIALVSFSARAQQYAQQCTGSRYYFDLRKYEHYGTERNETPFTPNVGSILALENALDMIETEGLENVFARHRLMRDMIRAGTKGIGLELPVRDEEASPTVTAVKLGEADSFVARIRERYGVEFAGGQGVQRGQVFRIGHMGYSTPLDMITALAVLEIELGKFGRAVQIGELLLSDSEIR